MWVLLRKEPELQPHCGQCKRDVDLTLFLFNQYWICEDCLRRSYNADQGGDEMRHLITGGAGFLGSHLCERLLGQGDEVICLDNLFTSRRRNIEHLLDHRGFEFVRHDVCEPFHFEVDRIWSLACPASPIHYQRNAARTIETSVLGTLHALRLAREVGARMLLTSTSEVYGDPIEHPQVESYRGNVNHVGPRACYDSSKCCAEAMASTWERQFGVEVRIARLFNVYGPRMAENDGRVVSTLVCQALRGEDLTIFGNGVQTRSFMYVSDLVDGLERLMGAANQCGPVNLGNPVEFTVIGLANTVTRLVGGGEAKIRYMPLPTDDPTRRKPDIMKARRMLDWEPRVSLEDGLRRTIDYFRGELGLPYQVKEIAS